MQHYSESDIARFVRMFEEARTFDGKREAVKRIWNDGYQLGEAETQLQILGERKDANEVV